MRWTDNIFWLLEIHGKDNTDTPIRAHTASNSFEGGVRHKWLAALRLRLITPQRGGEVMSMEWTEFDGDR